MNICMNVYGGRIGDKKVLVGYVGYSSVCFKNVFLSLVCSKEKAPCLSRPPG